MNIKDTLKSNKTLLVASFLIGAISMTAFSASAFGGEGERPRFTEEQKVVLQQAKELRDSGDHEAAKALLQDNDIKHPRHQFFENLTEDQKAVFEEAKALHKAGQHEEARALLEANDLPVKKFGPKGERPELTEEQKEILQQAKELRDSGDHEAAKALLQDNDIKPPHRHARMFKQNLSN